jgi:hypothetical protein
MNAELFSNILNIVLFLFIFFYFVFKNDKYYFYQILEKREADSNNNVERFNHYYFVISNKGGFKEIEVSEKVYKLSKEGDTITAL